MEKFQEWETGIKDDKNVLDINIENPEDSSLKEVSWEVVENSVEIMAVVSLENLSRELWLLETEEVKKLWESVSELMKNWEDYSELNCKYWDEIRNLESSCENKSEKTQIAVWLMTAKVRIKWSRVEDAIADLNAMLDYAEWMSYWDPEYWNIFDKINDIRKSLKK